MTTPLATAVAALPAPYRLALIQAEIAGLMQRQFTLAAFVRGLTAARADAAKIAAQAEELRIVAALLASYQQQEAELLAVINMPEEDTPS